VKEAEIEEEALGAIAVAETTVDKQAIVAEAKEKKAQAEKEAIKKVQERTGVTVEEATNNLCLVVPESELCQERK
jgi:hypothetical protein